MKKIVPLGLTALIIALDQVTKFFVVKYIPYQTIGKSFFGGFLRIIHTRNLAVAFSIGKNLSGTVRFALFTVIPVAVLILLLVYFLKNNDFSPFQRWTVAGILGGGFGNLIDRIFKPMGVVDFVDVKFYGIFGFERWPTFNVADASVVVCGILLFIAFMVEDKKNNE